jgi:hypothetical protein
LWEQLSGTIDSAVFPSPNGSFPKLVRQALSPGILGTFEGIDAAISDLPTSQKYQKFFRLALLSLIPHFSRAVATGGWLKWIANRRRRTSIPTVLAERVERMIEDVRSSYLPKGQNWEGHEADARRLPGRKERFSAVITSPPYPNRHDYTRVFGVELMFGFLNWEATRAVRYQSIHSHPEARPQRPQFQDYAEPEQLTKALAKMQRAQLDPKILHMLRGYFIDMHLCLRECQRVVKPGGRIAFVVGNAQYRGVPVAVDELLVEIGAAMNLETEKVLAVRFRGNSAQQMGEFGRRPSRESVVMFKKR